MGAMAPVGYVGTPPDIASLVGYIASKEAHFITGQSVSYQIQRKPVKLIYIVPCQISCDGGVFLD
jgi:NAD(P)-dependent dehydrogenase (short-subunit alcohol dehydrogenase family)